MPVNSVVDWVVSAALFTCGFMPFGNVSTVPYWSLALIFLDILPLFLKMKTIIKKKDC